MHVAETKGADLSSADWSSKAKKVQIIEFLTYGSRDPDEDSVIWAKISDKQKFISVKFSVEAVAEYRRINQTRLTQVKTALVILRKYRLIHCRVPLGRAGQKLTPEAFLALECSELRLLGSIGEPTMGNPSAVGMDQDLLKYMLELRNPGGGANFLKIRAHERIKRGMPKKGEEEKVDNTYKSRLQPPVSEVHRLAGPSSMRVTVENVAVGPFVTSLHHRFYIANAVNILQNQTKPPISKSVVRQKTAAKLQPNEARNPEHEITRTFVSIPEAQRWNHDNRRAVHYFHQLFADAGTILQPETGRDKKDEDTAIKRSGFIPLDSPSNEFGKAFTGPRSFQTDFLAQDTNNMEFQRKFDNRPTKRGRLRSSQKFKGSQESKFSQQLHTPGTSPQPSSPASSLRSQPLTDSWSSSDHGSPRKLDLMEENDEEGEEGEGEEVEGEGEGEEEEEEEEEEGEGDEVEVEEEEVEEVDSSPPPISPDPAQRQRFSARRASSPAPQLGDDPLPTPIPPTPAQRQKALPIQSTVPPTLTNEQSVEIPSFDLTFTQSTKDENLSPIRVPNSTPLPPLTRIPPAMPPPWFEQVKNGDPSYVQQLIPESSQFRPLPPTPAQRPRDPPPVSFDLSDPASKPPLSLLHASAKTPAVLAALSSQTHMRFPVQRKVPPPPPPPLRDSQTSPRVLAPNSDTSGTQSQSRHSSQSQSRSQGHSQSQLSRNSESDSQLMIVDTEKLLPEAHGEIQDALGDGHDEHDSLFSDLDDDDMGIGDHLPSDINLQHSSASVRLNGVPLEKDNLESDAIVERPLEVHIGNSLSSTRLQKSGICEVHEAPTPLTKEAADNIDNVRGDIPGSADGLHEDIGRTSSTFSPSRDPEILEETRESLQRDKERPFIIESVLHDVEAWSLPSFLRRKEHENIRIEEEAQSVIVKNGTEGKQKIRAVEVNAANERSAIQQSIATASNVIKPHFGKRSHLDQNEANPTKKKQKPMSKDSTISFETDRPKSVPRRKLDGFDPGFDVVPPGESFMSWERLQSIALKVGRARSRQAQTGQKLP
ncbi:hypothetical protein EV360DRAFT_81600 [Lentinula raphanica]|nr:hypothetical protein EV360DRAFT_81600 [Lentinula raphanica]